MKKPLSLLGLLGVGLFLGGCQLLIAKLGAEKCVEGDPDRCAGDNLERCIEGFYAKTPCDNGCNPDTNACFVCGDSAVDGREECDDGNNIVGDGCNGNCKFEVCGNNTLDAGEICDDGNTTSGDGCREDCSKEEICGDGALDEGELCDDANTVSGDGCRSNCRGFEQCGDGFVDIANQPAEACDDGNTILGDGCNDICRIEVCGNGVLDAGEECDDGNLSGADGCNAACQVEADNCGNGTTEAVFDEVCDDGNNTSGDGCQGDCSKIEVCGDGLPDFGEQCDDGNNTNTDPCKNGCQLNVCGDGIEGGTNEQCDDGNQVNNDACKNGCALNVCGDGVDGGPNEQCDDGNQNNNDGCKNNCTLNICGDGVVKTTAPAEQCDDGNDIDDDLCRNDCTSRCVGGVIEPISGHCYIFVSTNRTWTSAQSDCVSRGGHLATIANSTENSFVRSLNTANDLWIGLNDRNSEDAFSWVSGERAIFNNFSSGEPNNNDFGSGEDCVHLLNNNNPRWNDKDCNANFPYVCEVEFQQCGNGFTEAGETCDDGNTQNGDECPANCVFSCSQAGAGVGESPRFDSTTGTCFAGSGNTELNWQAARDFCIQQGGHLATIHTSRERNEVLSSIASNERFWIGLNDINNENTFVWDTGESVGFVDFGSGEPNNNNNQDCVQFIENDNEWDDNQCAATDRFVCEF